MFVLLNSGACPLSWMLLLAILSIHYPQLSCLASGPRLDSSPNGDSWKSEKETSLMCTFLSMKTNLKSPVCTLQELVVNETMTENWLCKYDTLVVPTYYQLAVWSGWYTALYHKKLRCLYKLHVHSCKPISKDEIPYYIMLRHISFVYSRKQTLKSRIFQKYIEWWKPNLPHPYGMEWNRMVWELEYASQEPSFSAWVYKLQMDVSSMSRIAQIPLLCKLKQLYKHLPVRFSIDTTYIAIDILHILYIYPKMETRG